jgi:hypothetical protein
MNTLSPYLTQELTTYTRDNCQWILEELNEIPIQNDPERTQKILRESLNIAKELYLLSDSVALSTLLRNIQVIPLTRSLRRQVSVLLNCCNTQKKHFEFSTIQKCQDLRNKMISKYMSFLSLDGDAERIVRLSRFLPHGRIRNQALFDAYVYSIEIDRNEGDVSIPQTLAFAMSKSQIQNKLKAEAAHIKVDEGTYEEAHELAQSIPEGYYKDSIYFEIATGNNFLDDYQDIINFLRNLAPCRGRNIVYGTVLTLLLENDDNSNVFRTILNIIPDGPQRYSALQEFAQAHALRLRYPYDQPVTQANIDTIIDQITFRGVHVTANRAR